MDKKAFEEATGKKIPYEIAPRRTGDLDSLYASTKLVESELGWQAKLTMKDMCKLAENRSNLFRHGRVEWQPTSRTHYRRRHGFFVF